MMKTVSVRIPDELKKKMKELSWINWSDVLRSAIVSAIDQHSKSNLGHAVLITEKMRKDAPPNWDSTDVIRKWRLRDE
ncbi:MAG: hypothetical protein ACW98K_04390 [Candidatus Kariarchaeaceae archaeon]|jgi:Arc/MetJ-type ribon-helix-helix transcriptional regulator